MPAHEPVSPKFLVQVKAGVCRAGGTGEHGDYDLDITGSVYVEAPDQDSALGRALDALELDDTPALTMGNGDAVEFEAVSAELVRPPVDEILQEIADLVHWGLRGPEEGKAVGDPTLDHESRIMRLGAVLGVCVRHGIRPANLPNVPSSVTS